MEDYNWKIGDKIARIVVASATLPLKICTDYKFEKTERNSYILRAMTHKSFWNTIPIVVTTGVGVVCFCKEEIPYNWIYFEVIGVSKSGKALFVKPVTGTFTDLLEYYDYS